MALKVHNLIFVQNSTVFKAKYVYIDTQTYVCMCYAYISTSDSIQSLWQVRELSFFLFKEVLKMLALAVTVLRPLIGSSDRADCFHNTEPQHLLGFTVNE